MTYVSKELPSEFLTWLIGDFIEMHCHKKIARRGDEWKCRNPDPYNRLLPKTAALCSVLCVPPGISSTHQSIESIFQLLEVVLVHILPQSGSHMPVIWPSGKTNNNETLKYMYSNIVTKMTLLLQVMNHSAHFTIAHFCLWQNAHMVESVIK